VSAGRRLKIVIKNALGLRGVKEVELLAGPARGVRMILNFSGHTPMYLGMYEWELHGFLRQVVPSARVVFDVGGYLGYDALLFAANSQGRIVTFEPDPDRVPLLEANRKLNPGLRDRITIETTAVARTDGDRAMSLDTAATRFGVPDLIKIDIDGGELDALVGGQQTLREKRPHLIVETHSKQLEDDCGTLLVESGYRPIIKHNRKIWREQRGGAAHNRWLLATGAPGLQ